MNKIKLKTKQFIAVILIVCITILLIHADTFAASNTYNCTVVYTLNSDDYYVNLIGGGVTSEVGGNFKNAVLCVYNESGKQITWSDQITIIGDKATYLFNNLSEKPVSAKCTLLEGSNTVVNGYIQEEDGLKAKAEITECIENTPAPIPTTTPTKYTNRFTHQIDIVNVNMTYKSDIMTVSPFYKLDSDYSKNVSMTDTSGKILLDIGAKNGHSNGIVAPYIKNNYVWFRSTGVGCTTVKVSYLTRNNMKRTKIYKVNVKAVGKEAYTKYFKVATGPAWNKKISKVSVNMKSGEKKRPTISWKKVKGATGYEVYQKGNASGYWIKIGNIKKGTRLRFGEVQKGYKVYLKVRPYKVKNGVKYFGKFTSKTVKAKKNVAPVKSGGEHRFSSENAFLLMNKERTKHHVKALKWSEQLYRMALTHAKYNAKKGVNSHEMKKNYKFTTPVLKATKQVNDACALWKIDNLPENVYMTDECGVHSGENCAANYNSPIYFVNGIKKSKPHYKTAMGACYSYSAVAFYEKNGSYKSVEKFDIYNCYKSN